MECTQRLYETQTEHPSSEEIAFLGICGATYPVKKGPNKIGRDPQSCSIVLNLNSVSRHHAVINVLSPKEFMLMDLDSANKTKIGDKTLQAYIPHPLKDGDTVQFGQIFGIFRLLENDNELPMTQAIDIPDTPVSHKYVSKVNHQAVTTIPESPEVSDRDDSFVVPSQPVRSSGSHFKSSSNHFIKHSGKTVSIQPIGSKKIDNVYWSSSKKSTSIQLDDSNSSEHDTILEKSDITVENIRKVDSIHDLNTQMPGPDIHELETQNMAPNIFEANTQIANTNIHELNTQKLDIHDQDTQIPFKAHNVCTDSIYMADTQIPPGCDLPSTSIHIQETLIPVQQSLPNVCKIDEQNEMEFDLFTSNKENLNNNKAESQIGTQSKISKQNELSKDFPNSIVSNQTSRDDEDDEILFDEVDNESFDLDLSQPILPQSPIFKDSAKFPMSTIEKSAVKIGAKRCMRIDSDSSTDCEDIDMLLTQKIPTKKVDDDLTDFEDEQTEDNKVKSLLSKTDNKTLNINNSDNNFEDMLTQVIKYDHNLKQPQHENISDIPTQIIAEDTIVSKTINEDFINQFKIPLVSPIKLKRKEIPIVSPINISLKSQVSNGDPDYYASTQEVFGDLCSQKEINDNELIPCSVEDNKDQRKLPFEHLLSPKSKTSKSCSGSDTDEKINDFVSNLSSQKIREVIGVQKIIKMPSDASDVDVTPKKRPFRLMEIELPNSQEIKTSVSIKSRNPIPESSSESDPEIDHEEQYTPILFRKKKASKNAKIDLKKKFDIEMLPTRTMTRVRKLTSKYQENEAAQKLTKNILSSKIIPDQEDEIDKEIINENLARLKNRSKSNKDENVIAITKKENDKSISKSKTVNNDSCTNKTNVELAVTVEEKPKSEDKHSKNKFHDDKLTAVKDKISESSSENRTRTRRAKLIDVIEIKSEETSTEKPPAKKRGRKRKVDLELENISKKESKELPMKEESKTEKEESKSRKENSKSKQTLTNTKEIRPKLKDHPPKSKENPPKPKEKTTRSTRSKRMVKIVNYIEDLIEIKDDETEWRPRGRQSKKAKEESPIPEVRRSKRQNDSQEKSIMSKEAIKSCLKKKPLQHEQSTVYSLSSDSDSPKNLKRTGSRIRDPSPKRSRSSVNSNTGSSRSTPVRANEKHYVLFTAFPCEEVKTKLEELGECETIQDVFSLPPLTKGAHIVTDVTQCTVLLTMQVKRTFKLLCAVGLGKPVVGPGWVQACADSGTIVDPWQHIIVDASAESRFRFSLRRTLSARAGARGFLRGWAVSSTPSVMPSAGEMKLIVESSDGTWKEGGAKWLCVSCSADRSLWPALRRRGATVVSAELILGGVLRQKLDIEGNVLK